MGVPEGEEREQELGNLFETIMTENFLNLVKEIDIQVQEMHTVPNKMNPKRSTPQYIIIKMQKVKDKETLLKAGREKQIVTYKGVPIRLLSADVSTETLQARREVARHIQRDEKQGPTTKIPLHNKAILYNQRTDEELTDKKKLKEFITTNQYTRNVK